MAGRLAGKIAVVTGIGSGIGKGCAQLFAEEGASVVGADINEQSAARTVEDIKSAGFAIQSSAPVDMFDPTRASVFMNEVGARFGRIDVLVNAAAVAAHEWIEGLTPEQFRFTMVGEVDTVFYACQAAWPHMKKSGGSIINFASVAAHMAVDGLPALAHVAGKGAVLAMTRQLAMEGGVDGIRANTISPGLTLTENTQRALDNRPIFRAAIERKTMVRRFGRPRDMAFAALYLASDESSFVTGADFRIDGGLTAW